jgi:hypothetical protein
LVTPKAHLTPRASKEVAFSYDHFAGIQYGTRYGFFQCGEVETPTVKFSGKQLRFMKIKGQ